MGAKATDPVMLSIEALFSNGEKYIIPKYQRNYDWGHEHLHQLLEDVWDMACNASERNYYLGTMVTYWKNSEKVYEILDGQQRMLTLTIILCALKNDKMAGAYMGNRFNGVNVKLDLRDESTRALENLYNDVLEQSSTEDSPIVDETDEFDTIRNMYRDVIPTLKSIFEHALYTDSNDNTRFPKFIEYLLTKVIITRITLPFDTDLNHYFEIANTRGEQLEKHEILKARILSPLKTDQKTLWLAGRIWDACSDMHRYVPVSLKADGLDQFFFTEGLDALKPHDFDDLLALIGEHDEMDKHELKTNKCQSIIDIINRTTPADGENNKNDNFGAYARYGSVINFPNFLLHVLRVMQKKDIAQDDKRLLETFGNEVIDEKFCKKFLWTLLRLRLLYDKFVIKRDYIDNKETGEWKILQLYSSKNGSIKYKNTFDESNLQKEIIMQESMFHVSSPGQNYKHWLTGVLLYLSEHPDGVGLNDYLRELGKAYMRDHFLQAPEKRLDYFTIIFRNKGRASFPPPYKLDLPRFDTHIDLFYFNYLDIQLWLQDPAQPFTFTSRNSVEHFYPQNPIDPNKRLDPRYLHSFGNLCLISREKNSKLSNSMPREKCEYYANQKEPDSLKQKKMLDICEKNGWWKGEIREHEVEMAQLLISRLADLTPPPKTGPLKS